MIVGIENRVWIYGGRLHTAGLGTEAPPPDHLALKDVSRGLFDTAESATAIVRWRREPLRAMTVAAMPWALEVRFDPQALAHLARSIAESEPATRRLLFLP